VEPLASFARTWWLLAHSREKSFGASPGGSAPGRKARGSATCLHGRGKKAAAGRGEQASDDMPSLVRILVVLGLLAGLAYAAMFALVNFVQPKPREITVTIPQDRLLKPH
jgi:hypothetical protein